MQDGVAQQKNKGNGLGPKQSKKKLENGKRGVININKGEKYSKRNLGPKIIGSCLNKNIK